MTDDKPAETTGTRIPDRPDFPVTWDDDIEPTLLWSWDNFHSPLPPTPMTLSLNDRSGPGTTEASKYVGSYRRGARQKIINGYPFRASTAPPLTDEEKAEQARKIAVEMTRVRANWDDMWLPELEADLEQMKAVRFAELTPDALWQTLERFFDLHTRHWNIHHRVVLPVIQQSNRLDGLCNEILGTKDETVASVLLHGAETLTVRSVKELEALATLARSDDEVCAVLEQDSSATEIIEALADFDAGRQWLSEMRSYLDIFGYRSTGFDLRFPTLVENQTFVFQVVRNLLLSTDEAPSDHESREKRLDAERDALLAKVREAGKGNSDLLARFESDYKLSQQIWPLKEDHSHYIDQGSRAMVRIAIAEVGRRLEATGAIHTADDIWYIDLDEAKAALLGDVSDNITTLISERRAAGKKFSKITPPRHLGTFPPDHEDAGRPEQAAESGGTLRGSAASKGEASGIARVVLSPDDFDKVRKGDVLVCRSTAPMWTPLFSVISALVSEAGGVLSHPAVVAREFNLPAVVGVQNATNLITDGQPITVSGTDGLVHTG